MENQINLIDNFCKFKTKYNLLLLNKYIKKIFLYFAYKAINLVDSPYRAVAIGDIKSDTYNLALNIINTLNEGPNIPSTIKLKKLNYITNSCYIDSVLYSILAPNIEYITRTILEGTVNTKYCENGKDIKLELLNIKNFIYDENKKVNYSCRNLRAIFKRCDTLYQFSNKDMNDPTEFLSKLFDLFKTDNLITETNTYVSNDNKNWLIENNRLINTKESIIRTIDLNTIYKPNNNLLFIEDFINYTDYNVLDNDNLLYSHKYKNKFKYVKNNLRIVYGDILIFGIFRKDYQLFESNNFIKYPIYPNQTLLLEKLYSYYLCSCVIYNGNYHYICYFKNNDNWYIYDDLISDIILIGSFQDMLKLDISPLTHGCIFIYNKN